LDDRGGSGGGTSDLLVISEQSSMESALTPVMATAAALTTTAGRGGSVTPVGRAESWQQPMGTGRPESLQPIGTSHSGRASPAAAHKASRGYSVIPEAHHAAYRKHDFLFLSYLHLYHSPFSYHSLLFP
jgi:hypothetical protein